MIPRTEGEWVRRGQGSAWQRGAHEVVAGHG